MELLILKANVKEKAEVTISRFQSGLNLDIRDKVEKIILAHPIVGNSLRGRAILPNRGMKDPKIQVKKKKLKRKNTKRVFIKNPRQEMFNVFIVMKEDTMFLRVLKREICF